jgi:hypothetical protein
LNVSKNLFILEILFLAAAPPPPPTADADVETKLDVVIKNPEIILLEDQHNSNSNCLVLDVSFLT